MSCSIILTSLIMFISIVHQVQAVYQMDIVFQPPVLANDQIIEKCVQFVDSQQTDDYLTHCLLIDQLPQWKPSELAKKNSWYSEKIDIQGASYTLRFRLNCYSDFYGETCSNFCQSSNDPSVGFYSCSSEGEKICHPGYSGSSCTHKVPQQQQPSVTSVVSEPKTSIEMPIIINYTFEVSCGLFVIFFGFALLSCLILTSIYLCQRQRTLTIEAKAMIPSVSQKIDYFCNDLPPRYSNSPQESEYAEIGFSSKDHFMV